MNAVQGVIVLVVILVIVGLVYWYVRKQYGAMFSLADFIGKGFGVLGGGK
jgi:hypothetical protein